VDATITTAMSDSEELKQAIEWISSFQVSIDPIVERWSRAIIAALEDRDRLRKAAVEVVVWIAPWEVEQHEPTETCPGCKLSRLLEEKP
jgi:hypothetical protein